MAGSDLLLAGVLFLFAAVIAVPLASRLGIGAVLGYLLAGIAIGPWGLGFISDVDEILHFSELGVVFLMFIIGAGAQSRQAMATAELHLRRWRGAGDAQRGDPRWVADDDRVFMAGGGGRRNRPGDVFHRHGAAADA